MACSVNMVWKYVARNIESANAVWYRIGVYDRWLRSVKCEGKFYEMQDLCAEKSSSDRLTGRTVDISTIILQLLFPPPPPPKVLSSNLNKKIQRACCIFLPS